MDIDGVISLFGFDLDKRPAGSFCLVDGIAHFLSAEAADHLRRLAGSFELVWCSGWEDKANDYLPRLLDLPRRLPFVTLDGQSGRHDAHWKVVAIERYAGARPLAWVDDAHDGHCAEWAAARGAPTLLVPTLPSTGLTAREAQELLEWARSLGRDCE